MQGNRAGQLTLAGLLLLASVAAAGAQVLIQYSPSPPLTLPQASENPVSPRDPGTLPGTTSAAGSATSGTNPYTGLPCSSGALPSTGVTTNMGLPAPGSLYGSASSGACD
jgi:hypothetical protein